MKNHITLKELQIDPQSRLDRDVITFVHTHKREPSLQFPERTFASEYATAMKNRFLELEKEKLFVSDKEQYELAPDWQKILSKSLRNVSRI